MSDYIGKVLDGSQINWDPKGWGIEFYYGAPVNCRNAKLSEYPRDSIRDSGELFFRIGEKDIRESELNKRLGSLNAKTGKKYTWVALKDESYVEGREYSGIATVGLKLKSKMLAAEQEHHGIIPVSAAREALSKTSSILEDLASIGLENLDDSDLCFHAYAYEH